MDFGGLVAELTLVQSKARMGYEELLLLASPNCGSFNTDALATVLWGSLNLLVELN
jgi:hypothetical protein